MTGWLVKLVVDGAVFEVPPEVKSAVVELQTEFTRLQRENHELRMALYDEQHGITSALKESDNIKTVFAKT